MKRLDNLTEIKVEEVAKNVFVGEMILTGRKSFTPKLVEDLTTFFSFALEQENVNGENRFAVFKGQDDSKIFNLGGDLNLFLELIENKDIESLEQYVEACVSLVHKTTRAKDNNMTTVAIINGETRGGGLESALSCDIVIAEKGHTVSLPETKMGFFPGIGAFELLAKRIGVQKAKEFILEGRDFLTEELYECGLFDYIVEQGEGDAKLLAVVKNERRSQAKHNSIRKIEDRMLPISHDDLLHSAYIWIDCMLNLSPLNKRMIGKIIQRQNLGINN